MCTFLSCVADWPHRRTAREERGLSSVLRAHSVRLVKTNETNPKLEHCTFFMRDGLFSKSERCCLPVIPCTTVYIAAVTKLRIHLSFTSWGWIICIVNILCYSAFASIMVALEPGTPYWVRWSHPRHLALTSLSMLFKIHMNCQLSKRGWSPSTMSLYRNDCS